jgi:hypothetical protein
MSDFIFSLDEIRDYIEKEIPGTAKPELLELLAKTGIDETNPVSERTLDQLGEKFLAEHASRSIDGGMTAMGDMPMGRIDFGSMEPKMKTGWQTVKKVLYQRFCTESGQKQTAKYDAFIAMTVPLIASKLGLTSLETAAALTAGVLLIKDEGVNAFCTSNQCLMSKE